MLSKSLSQPIKNMCLVASALAIGSFPVQAADLSKTDIEKIVKDYLMENGDVILDAVEAFQKKEEAERKAKTAETIKDQIDLLASADAPSAGNPDGDVTIIEFFDYNCGYCKRALPDINAIIKEDDNVRFVFREMPILGPSSRTAAKWALAAQLQGKYFEYHSALMEFKGQKTDEELAKLASKVGLDVDKAEADANSDKVQESLNEHIRLARLVGVQGTPAFIVGNEFFPGFIGKDAMQKAVAKARKNKQ